MRGTLAAASFALASVVVASCVSLHQLDGYASAVSELCAKLDECFSESYYPACDANSETRLDAAAAAERSEWLTRYADSNCLENCINARACIDRVPVCANRGADCTQKEQCCGFTKGKGDCSDSACCIPDGVACGDTSECCQSDCIDGLCGGFACLESGVDCNSGDECCTQICEPATGTCADQTCLPVDSACSDHFQCCTEYCSGAGSDSSGVCAQPSCIPDSSACHPTIPCCGGECVEVPRTGKLVCSDARCLPNGILCGDHSECCSTFCDPDDGRCAKADDCLDVGESGCNDSNCCAPALCAGANGDGEPSCCSPESAKCANNGDCCSGACLDDFTCSCDGLKPGDDCTNDATACCSGNCSLYDQACCEVAGCSHDVCIAGPPLARSCICSGCPVDPNSPTCVAQICNTPGMEDCCCRWWGSDCVDAVQTVCMQTCSVTELPPGGNQPPG